MSESARRTPRSGWRGGFGSLDSAPALADLDVAAEYIARDSPRQANLFVHRALWSTDRLAVFPRLGRVVPEIGDATIRELILFPYRIVYVVDGSAVEILLVHHSARPLGIADIPER